MKGDFTRDLFDKRNHFTRVLMQQGRVQLDADGNEQTSMLLHRLHSLAADLIGQHGGPVNNYGFRIFNDGITGDFFIGAGHYYVDGILCENDPDVMVLGTPTASSPGNALTFSLPSLTLDERQLVENDWVEVMDTDGNWHPVQVTAVDVVKGTFTINMLAQTLVRIRRLMTYLHQPDNPDTQMLSNTFLAYLDVWERHITCLDDQNIREVALGGPDTTTRAKVVWQVNLMPANKCEDINQLSSTCNAWMRARLDRANPASDPCIVAPSSRYRGEENLLYRVEIHEVKTNRQGETEWTFKWSRQNGSVEAIQLGITDDGGLIVNNTRGFAAGQLVEVTQEPDELLHKPGSFAQITKVEMDAIYLDSDPGGSGKSMWKLRRWDQIKIPDTNSDGALIGKEGEWLDLENGIQVYFEEGGTYCSGAYWYFPARVATGQIQWPVELDPNGKPRTDADENEIPRALPPNGIQHHYAPLAILNFAVSPPDISDCRSSFKFNPS
jgi:hypothetical protein